MKKITLYLFILAVLMNIFTYAYFSKKVAFTEKRYENLKEKLGDSLLNMQGKLLDLNKFSLDGNFDAQYYFENLNSNDPQGLQKLKTDIETALLEYNKLEDGNYLTGYSNLEGKNFEIDNMLILNHRWILANYSNGIYKGQVILKYFIDEENNVTFEKVETYLFTTKL
jgi:hypothetical protein